MNEIAIKILKQNISTQFARFLVTGAINTAVGFGIIFLLMFLGITPQISNICGYAVGLTVSFTLNRNWVFEASNVSIKRQIINFLLIFIVAFGINFLALNIFLAASINAYIAQILAAVCYTSVFYVLSKRVVFS